MSGSSWSSAVPALEHWLAGLAPQQLTTLLEERDLPRAADYERVDAFGALAAYLLTDPSVAAGMLSLDAPHWDLLEAVGTLAMERYGPPRRPPANTYPRYGDERSDDIEPYDRLIPESDLLNWLQGGGTPLPWVESGLARLREHALLLPAPDGQLAVPSHVHRITAGQGFVCWMGPRRAGRPLSAGILRPDASRARSSRGPGPALDGIPFVRCPY
ncbi:hypothetical protein AB0D35_23945 [Streptomyces sp. NPDC048301]|uniref:hypothetical protein n=1 Tax=Streptomyces sp. NPDC048301 TaxID=3155631 RepID=UPI0034312BC9